MLRFTGEKMSKSVGNVATIRETLDEWGREAVLVFFLTASWRKPIDFSPETMAQAVARRDTLRNAFTLAAADHDESGWGSFAARLDDDFDTPAALAVLHEWASTGQLELLRRGLRVFGLESLSERDEAPAAVVDLAERRLAARAERDFETADRLRDELAAARLADARRNRRRLQAGATLWRLRRAYAAFVTPDLVYGRRAVREALRGRRQVLEVWATERALKAEPWLAEARPKAKADRDLSERADTRDHQGVLALVEPYRYADAYELAAAERPLLAVLDRVTDPRNLGAVCRSAEGAGATGVVVPAHGSAVVTAAVARSSAGAIEHLPIAVVTNLARYLEEVKGADLWIYGAAGDDGTTPMWDTDLSGGVALVFGAEGKGLRPLVRRTCDALVAIPLAGAVESLNVSVAAALLLYEARRQRG